MEKHRKNKKKAIAKKTNPLRLLLAGSAVFLLCACQTPVAYEPLMNAGAQASLPVDPSQVEIFITKKPPYPYAELGVLSLQSMSNSPSDVYARFREAAAKLGATGVIMLSNQTVLSSMPHVNYDIYGNPIIFETPTSDTLFKGVAIKRVDSAADLNNISAQKGVKTPPLKTAEN